MTKANIKIAPSSVINYGGLDCIVLDVERDKILVLAKESIGNMPFDEGNSNNFPKGTLCKYLNGEFIKKHKANGADISALIPTTIDLTSDDGLKDYGETTQKIFLLTCDMYRKYRSVIPNLDDWWWLATAYSTESNGYASSARYVSSDGSLSNHVCLPWSQWRSSRFLSEIFHLGISFPFTLRVHDRGAFEGGATPQCREC